MRNQLCEIWLLRHCISTSWVWLPSQSLRKPGAWEPGCLQTGANVESAKSERTAREVLHNTTIEAKTWKEFGDILKKADTGSQAAISEERAGKWGLNTEWELSGRRGPSEGVAQDQSGSSVSQTVRHSFHFVLRPWETPCLLWRLWLTLPSSLPGW